MKPAGIYDRENEWGALEAVWRSSRPQLVFVLGRRRVGKSHVLARFAEQRGGVYYQATRRAEADQLAHLSRVVGARFEDAALLQGVAFPSWDRLLGYLSGRARDEPFLLVLDEFPYLAAASPALPSILQSAWDHDWPGSRIKVVLSGSYVTAMRRLEHADQPLYGRRTARLLFRPFDFADAAPFFGHWSARDRLLAYATFGHLPGHLAHLDPSLGAAENAASALLSPTGPLVDEAQHMLDAFLGEARTHYSILEAIAAGDRTWSGITSRVKQSGGALQRPLRWLEEMGLVERVVPATVASPRRSRRALYRLTDPYLAFWHRHVAPWIHTGSIGMVEPGRIWTELVEPRLADHLGEVFEDVCRQFVRRTDRLPFRPVRVGQWWDASSRHQVDVVATDAAGRLLVGECKWGAVGRSQLSTLRERARRIASELGGALETHLALFSARDDADETVRAAAAAGQVLYFTAEDLVAGA